MKNGIVINDKEYELVECSDHESGCITCDLNNECRNSTSSFCEVFPDSTLKSQFKLKYKKYEIRTE